MVDNQDSSVLRGLARFLGVPDDAEILQQAHFISFSFHFISFLYHPITFILISFPVTMIV
jgi:hypothetical protein